MYVYIYVCIYTYMHKYINTYIHTRTHTHIRTDRHTHTRAHAHTHAHPTSTHAHKHTSNGRSVRSSNVHAHSFLSNLTLPQACTRIPSLRTRPPQCHGKAIEVIIIQPMLAFWKHSECTLDKQDLGFQFQGLRVGVRVGFSV